MILFDWLFKSIKLSYGITVCNEAIELERLLELLVREKDLQDEIIVLQDITHRDQAVDEVLERFKHSVIVKECVLDNDFSAFKNNLLDLASGDYLFQIDADELPQVALIKKIKPFLKRNFLKDCFSVPRINIVNGISEDHINEWKWKIDDKGRINFPDFQSRIFKLNGKIKWINKVHEILTGWQRKVNLPTKNDDYCLLHVKDIVRQSSQNEFYKHIS